MKSIAMVWMMLIAVMAPAGFCQGAAAAPGAEDEEKQMEEEQAIKSPAELAKAFKLKEARNAEIQKKFEQDYQLETRIYRVQGISAKAACEMIAPDLHRYMLMNTGGKYVVVVRPGERENGIELKSLQETATWDDKSGLLMVKATPKTHQTIRNTLTDIERESKSSPAGIAMAPAQIEVILLRSGEGTTPAELPAGITAKDLESLGVKSVTQAGRAIVTLVPEKSDLGRVKAKLGDAYGVELAFQDYRQPYLVLRGSLMDLQKDNMPQQEELTLTAGSKHQFKGLELTVGDIKNGHAYISVKTPTTDKTDLTIRQLEKQIIGKFVIDRVMVYDEGRSGPKSSVRLRISFMDSFMQGMPVRTELEAPDETEMKLNRGESANFQYAKFTLVRVEKNDVQDQNDDTAELKVDAFGFGPQQTTIQEKQTQVIGEYEIEATEVEPDKENGAGRAVFKVRYMPQSMQKQMQQIEMLKAMAGRSGAIIENTVLLEPGKPQLLGVTNMREALILVLRWQK